ncbi:MAG: hypothetical protein ABWW65_04485 [Thermoprotei archaeon]
MSYRTFFNNIYYLSEKGVEKGFIFFDNSRIIDIGTTPEPEYEFVEYVNDYDYRAIAMHGFSIAFSPEKYVQRGLDIDIDLSTLSREEFKKIVYALLYELYMNGVTLPILVSNNVDLIASIAKEYGLSIGVIHEKGVSSKYREIIDIEVSGDNAYYNDQVLGNKKEIFCTINSISSKCRVLLVENMYTLNISIIAHYVYNKTGSLQKTLKLLTEPYRLLELDNGYISKNSKPDIVVYKLDDSRKSIPLKYVEYVILRGYPPDQVFVNGDSFFDRGEALVLVPISIYDIVTKL